MSRAKKINEALEIKDETSNMVVNNSCNNVLLMSLQAHIWHLTTKSYSVHMILDDFYNAMKEKADNLIETFIGSGGEFKINTPFELHPCEGKDNLIARIEIFGSQIDGAIEVLKMQDQSMLIALEEIKSEVRSTLYKLRNLN